MLQLEIYVGDVGKAARLFTDVFDMDVIQEHAGWRHLHHADNFDIMLFDPGQHAEENSHWPLPPEGTGGVGIEIVIGTKGISEKRSAVQALGYDCSELRDTPWGSTEFVFHMQEGYLLRIKQSSAEADQA